ncbi:MAG: MFS transporter [Gammaproteobacteria bacterium]|nr:MFS transporter [Gammaproteobacteria bacterium]
MIPDPVASALFNRRTSIVLFLGFSSGLPLALSGSTLQAWLTTSGVDTATIAAFSLVGLPYVLKFLWAPVMDRFVPPVFGRRRGWMILTQALLLGLLMLMAGLDPGRSAMVAAALAFMVAFCSASQDIAVDAYRADLLRPAERGFGAAMSVAGYRVAILVSGGLALIIADLAGWGPTYACMAALMSVGIASSVLGPEPEGTVALPASLARAALDPLREFFSRRRAVSLLALVILYKLGDAFAGTLTTTFLLRALEFSLTDVGVVNKWMGVAATLAGGLAGGALMLRFGLFRCLMVFGALQAITNLGFMVLALAGKSYSGLVSVIVLENLAGGMGTAVFVALLMALCDHRYTATQFALLSAIASLGRVLIGPPAGLVVEAAGWSAFFLASFIVALPGLGLVMWLRPEVQEYAVR